jgi:glycerophosphoryl diester phosphodiesterase
MIADRRDDSLPTPLIIAHRGARAFAPENTLVAFEKAARLGADMVELDVQLAADGEVVVVHDATLDRCSNVRDVFPGRGDYRVQSFTLADIERLDAGSWFVRELSREPAERQPFLRSLSADESRTFISAAERAEYAAGDVQIPTLRRALVRIHELGLRVNVELKAFPDVGVADSLTDRTVRLVEELGLCEHVLISSFDHRSLPRVKQLQPAIATGVLVTQPLADPVAYCREHRANAYHPGCAVGSDAVGFDSESFRSTGRLPAEPFRSLRAAGIDINVWTENEPARMKCLIDAGVTGIVTDYPNRLTDLLRRQSGSIRVAP